MTEEEKKPGGDEVTDEQLENVAGGSLTGGSIASLASKGGSGLAFPEVCKTPSQEAGTTPVTYDGDKGAIKDPTKDGTDSIGGIDPVVGTNSLEDGITHL